jgi:hypothetical protein
VEEMKMKKDNKNESGDKPTEMRTKKIMKGWRTGQTAAVV